MKTVVHQYEDRLLEFAYGELPGHEADAVDAHVRGCARCTQALDEIRAVRVTMGAMPMEAAPDAGLESLLAYAEQTARRNAEKAPRTSFWRRFMMPLASVAALLVVGVVAFRASDTFDPNAAELAMQLNKEDQAAQRRSEVAGDLARSKTAAVEPVAAAPAAQAPLRDGLEAGEQLEARGGLLEDAKDSQDRKPAEAAQAKDSFAEGEADRQAAFADNSLAAEKQNKAKSKPTTRASGSKLGTKNEQAPEPDWGNARGAYVQEKETAKGDLGGPGFGLSGGSTAAGPSAGGGRSPQGGAWAPEKKQAKAQDEEVPADALAAREVAPSKVQAPPPAVAAATPRPAAPPPAAAAPSAEPALDQTRADAPKTAERNATYKVPSKKSLSVNVGTSSVSSNRAADDADMAYETESLGDKRRANDDAEFQRRQRTSQIEQTLKSAGTASSRGDRTSEIRLCLDVLRMGAEGYQRVQALKRLCDAYEALGEVERADPYCDALVREFGNTAAAQAVANRRNQVQKAPLRSQRKAAQPSARDEAASEKAHSFEDVAPTSTPAQRLSY